MATAENFQQDFDGIMQTAHAVLARMNALDARMRHVSEMVAQANTAVEHGRQDVDQHSAQLHAAVTDLTAHVRDGGHSLAASHVAPLTQHFEKSSSHLDMLRDHLDQGCTALIAIMEKSHESLHTHSEELTQVDHGMVEGVRQTAEHVKGEADHMSQQFQGHTHPAMTGFTEFLVHVREQGQAHADQTHNTLHELTEHADQHMKTEFVDPMHHHVAQHADLLKSVANDDVDSLVHHLADEGRARLEKDVKHVISDLADHVATALDGVHNAIHDAGSKHGSVREALKPVFDAVEVALDPVKQTIDNVKSVASAVGFDV